MIFFRWQSVVDFVVLAAAIYVLLRWSKTAKALRLAVVIAALHASTLLARQLELVITTWVLGGATFVAVVILLVVYHSEVRQAFSRLDILAWLVAAGRPVSATLRAVSAAAWSLARAHLGGLIVISRGDSVAEFVHGGVPLGGEVSAEILEAIFRKVSPVHDGAALIEGNRITRVGVILPLTERADVPKVYGTRHRAGMGLAERCDALVLVASEESGAVTLMHDGRVRPMGSLEELVDALETLHAGKREASEVPWWSAVRDDLGLKAAAVGIAAMVWSLTFLLPGASVRTRTVPIELTNVPPGLAINGQSSSVIDVQLRASPWVFDSVSLNGLVARFDLRGADQGDETIDVSSALFNLPPGIQVEAVSPESLTLRFVPRPRRRTESR